jgi:diaminohydroxyphosphoribosylaminopyrimidine deaminase / 5-amino-6-(5-phosphoribosylamino)uracil reductase
VTDDARWMGAALALAQRGVGQTAPNPPVGCVIVKQGRVIGRGWTRPGGRPHAEAEALAQAGTAARGATLYTTLEPCAHESVRGPTCATIIPDAGVVRVVSAVVDPDPRTAGAGHDRLRAAGVAVVSSVREAEAVEVAAGFFARQRFGRPHVTLKLALSLDGAVAMASGESKWITGPEARAHAHLERARSDAILVGRGTWEADEPKLDVRLPDLEGRSPSIVILSRGDAETRRGDSFSPCVPVSARTISSPSAISELEGDTLLVEGGVGAAASFLRDDLVDRLLIYRAPILVGGGRTLGDIGLTGLAAAHGRWALADTRTLGADRLEVYRRTR